MLFLVTHLGDDRYVLSTAHIEDILPMVRLKRVPDAPAAVAGAFNYRGAAVPVVDLSQLLAGRAACLRLSTRLVIAHFRNAAGVMQRLGLIAERATETIRVNPMDFTPLAVSDDRTPYLGPIATDGRGLMQWIDPSRIPLGSGAAGGVTADS